MAAFKTILSESPINTDEYLLVAAKTAKDLGWDIHFVSDHGLVAGVPFSLRSNSWGETFTIWLNHGNVYLESKSNGTVIASKKNKHNVEDFLDLFKEKEVSMKEEEKETLHQWINENKRSGDEDILSPLSPKYRDPNITERWYLPRGEFAVTATLIGICVVVFGLMALSGANLFWPSIEVLIKWGADNRTYTVIKGEWWRMFTAIFLHIGIIHLFLNMASLYAIGILLEPFIGKWRFLAAFLITGVGGSIGSLVWNANTVSAGASGAIFGLFGVLLALLTTNLIEKSIRRSLLPNIVWVVSINLFLGIVPMVDYAAHIGGLITGLILGYLYFFLIRKTKQPVFYSVAGAALIGIVIIIAGFRNMDNVETDFGRVMEHAATYEEQGLEVFKHMEKGGDLFLIKKLGEETIPAWETYQKEINKLDALKLPPNLIIKKDLLKEYAALRLKFFLLLQKTLKEDTNQYETELKDLNERVAAILEELKKE